MWNIQRRGALILTALQELAQITINFLRIATQKVREEEDTMSLSKNFTLNSWDFKV
jgi:hypothetical protein